MVAEATAYNRRLYFPASYKLVQMTCVEELRGDRQWCTQDLV